MNQYDFTAPFEGIVPHLYLDSKGLITCGVGFLLPNLAAARALPWTPPSAIDQDWAIVRTLEAGHLPSFYRPRMTARLSDAAMRAEFTQRLAAFEAAMRRKVPRWNYIPLPARVALLDMAYNMGAGFFGSPRWPKFTAAALLHDWRTCARECSREDVQDERNQKTAELFEQAANL